jgi:hypothetical protein
VPRYLLLPDDTFIKRFEIVIFVYYHYSGSFFILPQSHLIV